MSLAKITATAKDYLFDKLSGGTWVDSHLSLTRLLIGALDSDPRPAQAADPLPVGISLDAVAASAMVRPADTTTYAIGDLIANNTTAGSVTPLAFACASYAGQPIEVRALRMDKTGATLSNALLRIHLFRDTVSGLTVGDNAAFNVSNVLQANRANYIDFIDLVFDRAFADGARGRNANIAPIVIRPGASTLYALIEARGPYAPASAEQFTVTLEIGRGVA